MTRYYLQTKKTSLSYSISDSETTIRLTTLTKLDGTSISASDIGDYMTGTFDPGTSKEEIFAIASSGVTINADGTVDITGVVRGLREGGTAGYSTGGYSAEHGAGAVVVFSNNPQLYNQLANKSNTNTFTALNTFDVAPQINVDPVSPTDAVRLSYVQALVLGVLTTINVIVPATAGATITIGQLVYFDETDNEWKLCDADTAATVDNVMLGIAQGGGTDGNPISNGVLLQGVDENQAGLTIGDVQYASNTAGGISNTPGTTEVTIGIAKSATELYFKPRFNQMITENQQDALGGTSGTPSATNKFVTNDDTTATPTANKVARFDANGVLPVYKVYTTLLCAETLAVGNLIASYYYQADGGILFDAKSNGSGTEAGASHTVSFTVGNNSNRALVVTITGHTTPSPTYNGVAMTLVGSGLALGDGSSAYMYVLLAPATGVNNLVWTHSAGNNYAYDIRSYYQVNQSAIDSSNTTIAASQVVTTVNDGAFIITSACSNQAGATPSAPLNFGNNGQSVGTGTGGRILSGDGGIIMPKLPTTVSATNAVTIHSVGLRPATAPSFGYGIKSSSSTATGGTANANKYSSIVGFVTAVTNGGIVGETATIQTDGVVTGLTGLIPLATYYVQDTAGTIGTTAGTNSKKIGVALTTTTLLIKHDN